MRKLGLPILAGALFLAMSLLVGCDLLDGSDNDVAAVGGGRILSAQVTMSRVNSGGNDPAGVDPVKTGYVVVTFQQTLTTRKYINLVVDLNADGTFAAYAVGSGTQAEWVAQNIPASVNADEPHRFTFVLLDPAVDGRTGLKGRAIITDQPIGSTWDGVVPGTAVESVDFTIATVGQETLSYFYAPNYGGGPFPDLAPASGPESSLQAIMPQAAQANFSSFHTGVPDIRQGPMECGPTSTADNLIWLTRRYGYADRLPYGERDLIERLKTRFGWTLANGISMGETFVTGKNEFCRDHNLPIETHRIGNWNDRDMISKIAVELDKGQAIEMLMGFYYWDRTERKWKRWGGHIVSVVGAALTNGTFSLDLHDPDTASTLDSYEVSGSQFTDALTLPNYTDRFRTVLQVAYAQSPTEVTPTEAQALGDLFTIGTTTSIEGNTGHLPYTGNPINGNQLHFVAANGTLNVTASAPFVPVSGPVTASGTFTASGTGTVAGYPDVTVTMTGSVSGGQVSGAYTMGAGGELPGGQPIIFNYTAPAQ